MLLFIISINAYLTQANWKLLLLSSGLTALAYLTRYIGVSIVVTGTIAILLLNKRKASQGLRDVFIYIIGSVLPTLFWYLRNWQLTGAMTNRAWGFHPPTRQQLYQGMVTISTWLLPVSVGPFWRLVAVSIIGFGLLVGLVLWSKRSRVNDRKSQRLIILLVLIMVIYGLMLIASLTFFDASTRLNDRILSPLYILTLVLSLVVIGNGFLTTQRPVYKSLIIITGLILVGVNVVRSQDLLLNMRSQGRGFTGSNWRNSETIAVVNDMSSDIILFSNEAFPIYFLTGKPTNWIPERVDVVKQKEREEYQTQMTAMRETLMQDNGALILFDTLAQRNVYAPISELTEDLILWKDTSDGAIYLGP
jgi:hypothetical protein